MFVIKLFARININRFYFAFMILILIKKQQQIDRTRGEFFETCFKSS